VRGQVGGVVGGEGGVGAIANESKSPRTSGWGRGRWSERNSPEGQAPGQAGGEVGGGVSAALEAARDNRPAPAKKWSRTYNKNLSRTYISTLLLYNKVLHNSTAIIGAFPFNFWVRGLVNFAKSLMNFH